MSMGGLVVEGERDELAASCRFVKGVGPKRAAFLEKLGIESIRDLLCLGPLRYEDRRSFTPIRRLAIGDIQTIQGRVIVAGQRDTRRRLKLIQIAVEDDTGVILATWFNQPYLAEKFKPGNRVILSGKVQFYGRDLQMMSPDYEILEDEGMDCLHTGRIVPIYPLTEGISQRVLRAIVKNAYDEKKEKLEETLPAHLLSEYQLMLLKDSFRALHFPDSFEEIHKAKERLSFEELLTLQLGLGLKRKRNQQSGRTLKYFDMEGCKSKFMACLPFQLTAAQNRCIREIQEDLVSPHPMNRLLQGDVGSGKTVVAAFVLFLASVRRYQAVMLVPTEVLADQHFQNLRKFFSPLGIRVEKLVGQEKSASRKVLFRDLKNGDISIVVGTHALLEEGVEFNNLAVIVIDEQHKFGVLQRASLREKGLNPDVLVMTATPIPRTLALTVYGDLDVSLLDELPPGRQKIHTYWIRKGKLDDAYGFIRQEISKGSQAYMIYPLVDQSEKLELKSATKMFEHLSRDVFQGLRLALIHGRMNSDEKNDILYRFKDRSLDILVSTTVIEVGIDIANANVMLIENAHVFGLAQLHQLRGRIGRGNQKSYCILEGDPTTEEGVLRLKTMVHTQDGFEIAERDLSIRGPGEFLGTRQHGIPELRFSNLVTDMERIQTVRKVADRILDMDPELSNSENKMLSELVRRRILNHPEYSDVG